jgi:hypothetical protein
MVLKSSRYDLANSLKLLKFFYNFGQPLDRLTKEKSRIGFFRMDVVFAIEHEVALNTMCCLVFSYDYICGSVYLSVHRF